MPQARLLPERIPLSQKIIPLWAALAERSELPGARWAVDRVLREDYLGGSKRGLEDAERAIPSR